MTNDDVAAAEREWSRRWHQLLERLCRDTAAYRAAHATDQGAAPGAVDAESELLRRFEREAGEIEESYRAEVDALCRRHEHEVEFLRSEHAALEQSLASEIESATAEIEKRRGEESWLVQSVLDEQSEDGPLRRFQRLAAAEKGLQDQLAGLAQGVDQATVELIELLEKRRHLRVVDFVDSDPVPRGQQALWDSCQANARRAGELIVELRNDQLSRLFAGWLPWILALAPAAALGPVAAALFPPTMFGLEAQSIAVWSAVGAGVVAAVSGIALLIAYSVSLSRVTEKFEQLQKCTANLESCRRQWTAASQRMLAEKEAAANAQWEAMVRRRDEQLARIHERADRELERIKTAHGGRAARILAENPARIAAATQRRDAALKDAERRFRDAMKEVTRAQTAALEEFRRERQRLAQASEEARRAAWERIAQAWKQGRETLAAESQRLMAQRDREFPVGGPYSPLAAAADAAGGALPAALVPSAIPVGRWIVNLSQAASEVVELVQAVGSGSAEDAGADRFELPAWWPFPGHGGLVLEAPPAARRAADELLQAVMLRLLTSMPPGTIRFTVIDPLGLGEHFAGFMHLADEDEQLINGRIWSEPSHVEQRLSEMTEHMETILQTYLRNDFRTIEDYNRSAGEVAEPYRIVVFANFPANVSEAAARRMTSLFTTGPRCGVYPLVSYDPRQRLPLGFDPAAFDQAALRLQWHDPALDRSLADEMIADPGPSSSGAIDALPAAGSGSGRPGVGLTAPGFVSSDPDFAGFVFEPDRVPPSDRLSAIIKAQAQRSREARKVEVAFERIAPARERWWSRSSAAEIDVPLGRAGATRLQHLRLGRGTSQHLLVAGKTGSGKSTFLHALITNAALHYAPSELELYLVDFKKGVEFKAYAEERLPHARVIAIESDREFGESVLQRLDEELQRRGDLFRDLGVQDVAAFRAARPDRPMPRILLVVDEFQEFFVEDDRIAQRAGLLLDRLVRQGRAFGIHVVLGTQTLAGAYTLARSTLGQIAVRVALQCSETDAHLILSEQNTAARLLSRPGEAIYNDANGLIEGNHAFQVAWLPDSTRERYLRALREMPAERAAAAPAIVFEGNIPSDPRQMPALAALVRAASQAPPSAAPSALEFWLGEPIAIAEPTRIVLHRQPGENLLLVGQNSGAAQGVLSAAMTALSAQLPPASLGETPPAGAGPLPTWILLDGSTQGTAEAAAWSGCLEALPQTACRAAPRESAAILAQVVREIERRGGQAERRDPPLFLCVDNLGQFRDLRRAADDFSFGSFDTPKTDSPPRLLGRILQEGPAVGVHALVWCDTFSNLNRWLTPQQIREFEIRVAFQMNANDSSTFLDTPAASRLGPNRALVRLEQQGTLEKIRPFRRPDSDYWRWVAAAFSRPQSAEV